VPLFIKKWYKHPPHYINGVLCRCNFTLTADGNWKITRTKCIYGDPRVDFFSTEFGRIPSGCRLTPIKGSYYCASHDNYEIKFRYKGSFKSINPNLIIPSILSINHVFFIFYLFI